MKKTSLKAFSLVEISVVLLIISAVIAGIVKGNNMLTKSRLSTAQTLTQNAPLKDMPDLVLWLETSLDSSFILDEIGDGNSLTTWYDSNPDAATKNNATQAINANRPKYYESIFYDSIPAVKFDGFDDFMNFSGDALINISYTVFVIEQKTIGKNFNIFIGGNGTSTNSNLYLGYETDQTITMGQYGNDLDYTSAPLAFSTPTTRMHTFLLKAASGGGKQYWLNGGGTPEASNAQVAPLASFLSPTIGKYNGSEYFDGNIGEIIIFNRALRTEERQLIETYLSKKYNIKIS